MISIEETSSDDMRDWIVADGESIIPPADIEPICRVVRNSTLNWIWWEDASVAGLLGVVPISTISNRAYIWMYSTEQMLKHPLIVLRHSKRIISRILVDYPIILGHSKANAENSIRWMKWLGAEYKAQVGDFLPFEIRAKR